MLNFIVLLLLLIPHVCLALAWAFWKWSPPKSQSSKRQNVAILTGLVCCSLNLSVFWIYIAWLNLSHPGPTWWKMRDAVEIVADILVGMAVLAPFFGKGRARLPLFFAAVTGWFLWVIGHIGIL